MSEEDFVVEDIVVEEEELNMEINVNPKAIFNADITNKKLATKKLTVGQGKGMNIIKPILLRKLKRGVSYSWLILLLKDLMMVYGLWTVDAVIICLEQSPCLRSLMSHKKVKLDFEITSRCKLLANGLFLSKLKRVM